MDTLVDLPWRAYPGGALLALGVLVLLYGLVTITPIFRPPARDPEKPIVLVTGLRVALIGTALAGLAGAWIWHQLWLFVLALVVGAEELLETSVILYALRRGRRLEAQTAG